MNVKCERVGQPPRGNVPVPLVEGRYLRVGGWKSSQPGWEKCPQILTVGLFITYMFSQGACVSHKNGKTV